MELINKQILDVELFQQKHSTTLDYPNILERYCAIGGFSYPLPSNIQIYYFLTFEQKHMVFETYLIGDGDE